MIGTPVPFSRFGSTDLASYESYLAAYRGWVSVGGGRVDFRRNKAVRGRVVGGFLRNDRYRGGLAGVQSVVGRMADGYSAGGDVGFCRTVVDGSFGGRDGSETGCSDWVYERSGKCVVSGANTVGVTSGSVGRCEFAGENVVALSDVPKGDDVGSLRSRGDDVDRGIGGGNSSDACWAERSEAFDGSIGASSLLGAGSGEDKNAEDKKGLGRTPGVGIRGKNYERNRNKRARRKASKKEAVSQSSQIDAVWRSARVERRKREGEGAAAVGGFQSSFVDVSAADRKALKESYVARLQAENELKMYKAKQQLELEKAKDIGQLKKRQETQIMRQTELNKVQVEKAFMQLSRAGSVPGVSSSDASSAQSPVFSGIGSGSISPNSSVSHAEILELKKSDLSKTHEIGELRARLDKLRIVNPQVYKELGFEREIPPTVGSGVTVDEHGNPIIGGFEDDSSLVFGYDGYIGEDGRFHFGENPAIYDA